MPLSNQWKRHGLLLVGVIAVCVAAPYTVSRTRFNSQVTTAKQSLASQDFDAALAHLVTAAEFSPQSAEVEYLKAVANRRLGNLNVVEKHLTKAEKLGWSADDVFRQRLLVRAQLGRFDEVEESLQEIIQEGTYDEAALEIYEALANGYVANHELDQAMMCVDFWIRWRPSDIRPRKMRADVLMLLNDWSNAEAEYRRILDLDPADGSSREMLGRLVLDNGQVDEAKRELERAIADGNTRSTVFATLAQCEMRLGQPEKARKLLQDIEPGTLEAEQRAGALKLESEIALFEKDEAEAVRLLEEAMQIWPHDSSIQESLARVYARMGDKEKAEESYEAAQQNKDRAKKFLDLQKQIQREPNNPQLRHEAGLILLAQGFEHDAAKWFRSAIRHEQLYLPSHLKLIDYFQKIGDEARLQKHDEMARSIVSQTLQGADEAIQAGDFESAKFLQQALADAELPILAQNIAAKTLIQQGENAKALELLRPLMEDAESRGAVCGTAGSALVGMNKPLEAEPLFKEAVQFNPADVTSHRWLAVIYYDMGAMAQAQQHLEKVAELDPKDYRPFRLLGLASKDYGFYLDAIDYYKEAIRRNPQMPPRNEVDLELAECQIAQKEYTQALATLETTDPSAQRDLLKAECLYNTGEDEEAVAMLDHILGQSPKMVRALVLRADAALVANDAEKAVELLKVAVQEDAYSEQACLKYSQALSRVGDKEEAQKWLQRSEELIELKKRFSKLHQDAVERPYDASIRRELAEIAIKIGREDLAKAWSSVAEFLDEE